MCVSIYLYLDTPPPKRSAIVVFVVAVLVIVVGVAVGHFCRWVFTPCVRVERYMGKGVFFVLYFIVVYCVVVGGKFATCLWVGRLG